MADSRIVAAMAKRTCRPRTEAGRMLDALLDEIRERLRQDGEVAIDGFGRFRIASTGRRVARNFATGETIQTEGRRTIRFDAYGSAMTGRRSRWHLPPGEL
ncbi:HU family DNA-binding protein [Enterovirga rhinocerotis]|uniref:Viral histone-like protein n=1 Tax=Enterovirga rhinocerotis TaxID=1339210 RepID=A0A4R7C6C8_9HYPH|nr:HU family DNA-binding protein [Enterovirga rhinocerotis]TDR93801.1 DNA-binding protein HU-beta [Enterovirga rhinocerotis]